MVDSSPLLQPSNSSRRELMFPILDARQVARVAAHGSRRAVRDGEVLIKDGQPSPPFFVVTAGQFDVVRPSDLGDTRVAVHGPGGFTGEANMLLGRRSLMRTQATGPGEVIELTHDQLQLVIQTDTEISEIVMRAFIFSRVELIAQGIGDVVLIGSQHSAATLRIKEFLTRNGHPFAYLDLDRDADVQQLLDHSTSAVAEIPVYLPRRTTCCENPTNRAIADCLGFNHAIERDPLRDLLVVGAGPRAWRRRSTARPKASTCSCSSRTPPADRPARARGSRTISAFQPASAARRSPARAFTQAEKFGAEICCSRGAAASRARGPIGCRWRAATIPARTRRSSPTGADTASWRSPIVARFEGAGVYYGATTSRRSCATAEEVIVVGGGNSAGQAAMFLSRRARHVHMLVRGRRWREACRATSFGASKTRPTSPCARARRSSASKAATPRAGPLARTTRPGSVETA